MKSIAIMQPYFFPYLGYFQLIDVVDQFVILDDVQFIKKGWVNRNYILNQEGKSLFTLPIANLSQNKLISQLYLHDQNSFSEKFLRQLHHTYSKAPFYNNVIGVIEEILQFSNDHLVSYIEHSLSKLKMYLGIETDCVRGSAIHFKQSIAVEHILDLCDTLQAEHYINLSGGSFLYEQTDFAKRQIELSFIEMKPHSYKQFNQPFVSGLSIIDIMMFNDVSQIKFLLQNYKLYP